MNKVSRKLLKALLIGFLLIVHACATMPTPVKETACVCKPIKGTNYNMCSCNVEQEANMNKIVEQLGGSE